MDPNGQSEITLRSANPSVFNQSGQIDWVNLLRGTAEASISFFTRLSGAGVEPMTVLVAQGAFSLFRIPTDGQRNILEALSSLRAFGAFGDALWFGFGVQHVTRSLAKSREGLACVAMCAALGEVHSPEISALVLHEFSDINAVPKDVSPSIAQWKQLVKACSGCLVGSRFGHLVRELADLQIDNASQRLASNPRQIAEALSTLAKVSSEHLDSITLSGGVECAWLGAVSQWLLGLSISCETDGQSAPVYRGSYMKEDEVPRVKIVYDARSPFALPRDPSSVLVSKKCYRLDHALPYLDASFEDAIVDYEAAVLTISSICTCPPHRHGADDPASSKPDKKAKPRICLVVVSEFIIQTARVMSGVLVTEGLYPTQAGLLHVYHRIYERQALSARDRLLDLAEKSFMYFPMALYSDEHVASPYRGSEAARAVSATAHRGICFNMEGLVSLPGALSPEALSRIHIVPGTIHLGSRTFSEVHDAVFEAPKYFAASKRTLSSVPAALDFANSFRFADNPSVVPIVGETENYITFSYRISSTKTTSWVTPAALAYAAAVTRLRIPCKSTFQTTQCSDLPLIRFTLVEGEGQADLVWPSSCFRVVPQTAPAWCVALLPGVHQHAQRLKPVYEGHDLYDDEMIRFSGTFLRVGECLSCCYKTAARHDAAEIIYVV